MFHVERNKSICFLVKNARYALIFLFLVSCGVSKLRTEIPDYLIVPNGKEVLASKSLYAFVFENNQTKIPFQQYLAAKYNDNNYEQREMVVIIEKEKYRLIFYDIDEFEKYFGFNNFIALNQEIVSNRIGNQPKFIAVSLISASNEDCLQETSLYFNNATRFLKNLKDEYLKN